MSDVVKRDTVIPAAASQAPVLEREALTAREFLAFVIAEETYALPLHAIREILKPPPITPVPRAPGDVLGVVAVRGTITTVIDLRRRLRVAESPPDKHTRILLVAADDEVLGVLVDQVLSVHRLLDDEIELSGVVGGDLSDYVLGVGRPRRSRRDREGERDTESETEEILVLLDPEPLLD
ncbi:MAG TPA: chemotaxis protein CheW [Polyangiaceae bacterium LLY-WYZ-15_(1-7)]|nr:chemotaxis protein CheW [Polyangiaceae bacterium LLY-WYZ-15_(1-7)]